MQIPLALRPTRIALPEAPLSVKAKIVFNPQAERTANKQWWAIAAMQDRSIAAYYQHWIWELFRCKLTDSAWKPHCTIIRGEPPRFTERWGKAQNASVLINYSPEVWTNGKHWWLPAASTDVTELRKYLGLKPDPTVPLHITIGSQVY